MGFGGNHVRQLGRYAVGVFLVLLVLLVDNPVVGVVFGVYGAAQEGADQLIHGERRKERRE